MRRKDLKRVQFDFSPEALEKLDNLVRITNASSRAEAVRQALNIYDFLISKSTEDYEISLTKGKEKLVAVMPTVSID